MMEFAKDLASNIGCATADLAKRVGSTSADLARSAADSTAGFARSAADSTVDLARRIGPKRGLIGLAIAGVAIGGTIVLVRYLRARSADAEQLADEAPVAKNKRVAKAEARARNAYAALH